MSLEIVVGGTNERDEVNGVVVGFKNRLEKVKGVVIGRKNEIANCKGLEIGFMCDKLRFPSQKEYKLSGVGIHFLGFYEILRGISVNCIAEIDKEGNGALVSFMNLVSGKFRGINIGIVNASDDEFYGVQAGAVCYAGQGNYLQVGLLNFRKNDDGELDFSIGLGYHHIPRSKD